VTYETQTGPAPPDPLGDVPAVVGPDAPTDVVAGPQLDPAPAVEVEPVPAVPPPPPAPPPAPAIAPPPPHPPTPDRGPDDSGGPAAVAAERPEIAVGAAFAGGLVLALILKRLAR
jgi:hypothetical protein